MNLSPEEICMVEQLCYLDEDVLKLIGKDGDVEFHENSSIKEILSVFTDEDIEALRRAGDTGSGISGKDWADIITYIRQNERINSLVLKDTMYSKTVPDCNLAYCFVDPQTNDCLVAFNGTRGELFGGDGTGYEWYDNFEGLYVSDTEAQIEALNYIESLEYEHITVTGHSKGANKAMYVTLLSDKIDQCYSFDGQGFSSHFYEKYPGEVSERASRIHNYSLSTDFVHILLFPVPGSDQIYCQGYDIATFIENHAANSFFQTQDGSYVLDANGRPVFVIQADEDPAMKMLRNFVVFMSNVTTDDQKRMIVEGINDFVDSDGTIEDLLDTTVEQNEAIFFLIALIIEYAEYESLSHEDVYTILAAFGIDTGDDGIKIKVRGEEVDLVNLVMFFIENKTDIREIAISNAKYYLNPFNLSILNMGETLARNLLTIVGVRIGLDREKIQAQTPVNPLATPQIPEDEIRDFSNGNYEMLRNAMQSINQTSYVSDTKMLNYASERWYNHLMIDTLRLGLNAYFEKVNEITAECRGRMEEVFGNVYSIDQNQAKKVQAINDEIVQMTSRVQEIAESIKVISK